MCLFRSDPRPVSFLKVEMDCRRRLVDLWLVADEERSAYALKRIADYIDHRPDRQYLHYLQSTEGFGSVPLSPGWEWEHSSGLEEGDLSQRICDLDFERSYHDSLHFHLEKPDAGKQVGFAEVHHKDFAGRWRSNALGDFVKGGNSLAGMEVNTHSHLQKVSSRRKLM